MSHPFRENLEVRTESDESWIGCTRCGHRICRIESDWKEACSTRTFPPTKAGPLMGVLVGRYVLVQRYCPSCGTLLDADLVEEPSPGDRKTPQG